MILNLESPPLNMLHNTFFSLFVLVSKVQISYAHIMTLSIPLPSRVSLLYRSKTGIIIFVFG